MKKLLMLALASLTLLAACGQQTDEEKVLTDPNVEFPQLNTAVADKEAEVQINTSMGAIRAKLFPEYAPLAVENFLTHAKEGYYNGLTFHRVISNFMIQGGDPNGDGSGGTSIWNGIDERIDSGAGFANEISPYLYNIRGSLAMANAGADTNGSQFFINQKKQANSDLSTDKYPQKIIDEYAKGGNAYLDGGYTVFGQVISGMNVVDAIAAVSVDANDKPRNNVTINSIDILKDYDFGNGDKSARSSSASQESSAASAEATPADTASSSGLPLSAEPASPEAVSSEVQASTDPAASQAETPAQ